MPAAANSLYCQLISILGYAFLVSLFLTSVRKKVEQIIPRSREKMTQVPCSGVGSTMLPRSQLPAEKSPPGNNSLNERRWQRLAPLPQQKIRHENSTIHRMHEHKCCFYRRVSLKPLGTKLVKCYLDKVELFVSS